MATVLKDRAFKLMDVEFAADTYESDGKLKECRFDGSLEGGIATRTIAAPVMGMTTAASATPRSIRQRKEGRMEPAGRNASGARELEWRESTWRLGALLSCMLGLSLLLPGVARAQTAYTIQPIVKAGDTVGGVGIRGSFSLSGLNDRGQLAFLASATPGNLALFAASDGQVSPLVVSEGEGPDGPWPRVIDINPLVSINQQGDIAFSLIGRGVYLWSATTKTFTAIATVGMPAADGLTFSTGTLNSPSLNNRAEVVVGMAVKDAAGKVAHGLFLHSAEGKLMRVAVPGQALPDGSTIQRATGAPTLNDAGVFGFYAERSGSTKLGAYLWEQGTLTPVAEPDTILDGEVKIAHISTLRVNNRNRDVLVALIRSDTGNRAGLYRLGDGKLIPLLLPGQDLPDGSKLLTLRQVSTADAGSSATRHISRANELGEYAFVATPEGGGVGAYRLDADGKLSLILKTGMTTDQGTITQINPNSNMAAVGLNSKGQVALSVRFDNGPETLVLLTPKTP